MVVLKRKSKKFRLVYGFRVFKGSLEKMKAGADTGTKSGLGALLDVIKPSEIATIPAKSLKYLYILASKRKLRVTTQKYGKKVRFQVRKHGHSLAAKRV